MTDEQKQALHYRLGRRYVFYFAFRRFERDATATAAKTIRPTKISRT
jgi:hypothetical protein